MAAACRAIGTTIESGLNQMHATARSTFAYCGKATGARAPSRYEIDIALSRKTRFSPHGPLSPRRLGTNLILL